MTSVSCTFPSRTTKRHRVDYSKQEVTNLLGAVHTLGTQWTKILETYDFHPARTTTDLKDKYKQLKVC